MVDFKTCDVLDSSELGEFLDSEADLYGECNPDFLEEPFSSSYQLAQAPTKSFLFDTLNWLVPNAHAAPRTNEARFQYLHNFAPCYDYMSGYPNFHQADHGDARGIVYGAIFLKHGAAEYRDIPVSELGNPQTLPDRFRAVHDWAGRNGYMSGYPNFHQADHHDGRGIVYGAILLKHGHGVYNDIPASELGNPQTDAERFRAVNDWASRNDYMSGYPNFHQADHHDGRGVVYGAILLKPEAAQGHDIPQKWFQGMSPNVACYSFHAEAGNCEKAREKLTLYDEIALFPDGHQLFGGRYWVVAKCFHEAGQCEQVAQVAQEVLDHMPNNPWNETLAVLQSECERKLRHKDSTAEAQDVTILDGQALMLILKGYQTEVAEIFEKQAAEELGIGLDNFARRSHEFTITFMRRNEDFEDNYILFDFAWDVKGAIENCDTKFTFEVALKWRRKDDSLVVEQREIRAKDIDFMITEKGLSCDLVAIGVNFFRTARIFVDFGPPILVAKQELLDVSLLDPTNQAIADYLTQGVEVVSLELSEENGVKVKVSARP